MGKVRRVMWDKMGGGGERCKHEVSRGNWSAVQGGSTNRKGRGKERRE